MSGVDMITFKPDGNGIEIRWLPSASVDTSGPVDWSAASTKGPKYQYAIRADVVKRKLLNDAD